MKISGTHRRVKSSWKGGGGGWGVLIQGVVVTELHKHKPTRSIANFPGIGCLSTCLLPEVGTLAVALIELVFKGF